MCHLFAVVIHRVHLGVSLTAWQTEKVREIPKKSFSVWRWQLFSKAGFICKNSVSFNKYFAAEFGDSGEQNGYNIPELSPAPEVEKILSESSSTDFKSSRANSMGEQVKRLCSDAYMCFYQSPDVRMYR